MSRSATIAEAQKQIGLIMQVEDTAFRLKKEKSTTGHASNEQPRSAEPGQEIMTRGRLVLRSLLWVC